MIGKISALSLLVLSEVTAREINSHAMSKFIFPEEPLVDWDKDSEIAGDVLVTEAAMVTTLTR